jgi:tRNA A37 threonylcarbamoyladenosine synthetase subunit TsaC/SUA5/YrdC
MELVYGLMAVAAVAVGVAAFYISKHREVSKALETAVKADVAQVSGKAETSLQQVTTQLIDKLHMSTPVTPPTAPPAA